MFYHSMRDMISGLAAYGGLFLTALAAGSILPVQSEAVLAGMMIMGDWPVWMLILVASLGNTGGAVINWYLGRTIEKYENRKWFPANPEQMAKAHTWYNKYGRASLLLSWVPVLGDGLTVMAGVMRERLGVFTSIVFVGKAARYIIFAWLTLQAHQLIT